MNKYYGNNVEVEKDGVIFKYAHLETVQVKENEEIKQGDKIGLMEAQVCRQDHIYILK